MENFYIESYTGIDTWIDVENGIVIRIDSNLNPKISEKYVGKTISFMKSDFEKRMKPAWVCVHSLKMIPIMNLLNNIKSQISQAYNNKMSRTRKGMSYNEADKLLKSELSVIEDKRKAAMQEYNKLKDELFIVHNFTVDYKLD